MSNPLDFWRGSLLTPFRDAQFQRAVDRIMDDWAGPRMKGELQNYSFNPTCEVSETKANYLLKFDLPGVNKDQIKIDMHENQLTVSGERREEKKEEDKKRHLSEVFYGSFMRSFTFPTTVDPERIEAKYDNGVLSISVPKSEATRARQITIR